MQLISWLMLDSSVRCNTPYFSINEKRYRFSVDLMFTQEYVHCAFLDFFVFDGQTTKTFDAAGVMLTLFLTGHFLCSSAAGLLLNLLNNEDASKSELTVTHSELVWRSDFL